jgi:hypothetical protein
LRALCACLIHLRDNSLFSNPVEVFTLK